MNLELAVLIVLVVFACTGFAPGWRGRYYYPGLGLIVLLLVLVLLTRHTGF